MLQLDGNLPLVAKPIRVIVLGELGRQQWAQKPLGPVSASVRAASAAQEHADGLWSPAVARHCWNDSHPKGGSEKIGSMARTQHTRCRRLTDTRVGLVNGVILSFVAEAF